MRLWNPAAERIFGWPPEEMIGRGDLPLAPPSKRAESEDLFARVRAGESVSDFETVRQRKDGTLVDVSIAAAPVTDGSGRVVGNMVAYTDITERKAQEAELHRLNTELHARLEELAASRARIVTAADVARRRLERNLHDGRSSAWSRSPCRCGSRSRSSIPILPLLARRSPTRATSLPSRSRSCASSPAASIQPCSAIGACGRRSRRSRLARRSRSRSPTSRTNDCRSRSRRLRTT